MNKNMASQKTENNTRYAEANVSQNYLYAKSKKRKLGHLNNSSSKLDMSMSGEQIDESSNHNNIKEIKSEFQIDNFDINSDIEIDDIESDIKSEIETGFSLLFETSNFIDTKTDIETHSPEFIDDFDTSETDYKLELRKDILIGIKTEIEPPHSPEFIDYLDISETEIETDNSILESDNISKRNSRTSEKERHLLLKLCEANISILQDNNESSMDTKDKKNRVWKEIQEHYNSSGVGPHKTILQLKRIWQHMQIKKDTCKFRSRDPFDCPICHTNLKRFDSIRRHLTNQHPKFVKYCNRRFKDSKHPHKDALFCALTDFKKGNFSGYDFSSFQDKGGEEIIKSYVKDDPNLKKLLKNTSFVVEQPVSTSSQTQVAALSTVETSSNSSKDDDDLNQTEISDGEAEQSLQTIVTRPNYDKSSTPQPNISSASQKCATCSRLKLYRKHHLEVLKSEINNKKRISNCCKDYLKEIFPENIFPSYTEEDPNSKLENDNFMYKYDHKTKSVRYFCIICIRYANGSTGRKFTNGDDWIFKGVDSNTFQRKRSYYLRRHVNSEMHQEAVASKLNDNREGKSKKFSTDIECKSATANLCKAVQFMTDNDIPYDNLTSIASFVDSIMPTNVRKLLGNRKLSTENVQALILSNYESGKNSIQEKLKTYNSNTKQLIRHAVAVDKSTAQYDASRQVIVDSFVDIDGCIKEVLLGATRIFDSSGYGSHHHAKSVCQQFMDTKNIVSICTNAASVYTEKDSGMYVHMLNDKDFSKNLIHLIDVCHRIESLLNASKLDWIQTILEKTSKIVSYFSRGSLLNQALFSYSNQQNDFKFVHLVPMIETHYGLYGSQHIMSILNNVPIFKHYLPIMIDSSDFKDLKTKCVEIYNCINDASFILQLMLINTVFIEACFIEREAQSKNYGPFELNAHIPEFRNKLVEWQEKIPKNCEVFLETNVFEHSFTFNKQNYIHSLHFNFNDVPKHEILNNFKTWIETILCKFDTYLEIPKSISLACDFFSFEITDENKHSIYIELLNKMNIEFYPCNKLCEGFNSCNCIINEISTFFQHCKSKFSVFDDITEIFKYYLSNKSVWKLDVTNIIRLMEATLLLKASYSSIERINSVVANIVEGHFENRYVKSTSQPDLVESLVFVKSNLNFKTLDYQKSLSSLKQKKILL